MFLDGLCNRQKHAVREGYPQREQGQDFVKAGDNDKDGCFRRETSQNTRQGYQEKEWTERYDGKNHHYSYEGFWVDTVPFSYFRNVEMPGFTNTAPVQYPIRDGLPVRIHYIPERQITDGSITNRIVKLEVAEPHPQQQALR